MREGDRRDPPTAAPHAHARSRSELTARIAFLRAELARAFEALTTPEDEDVSGTEPSKRWRSREANAKRDSDIPKSRRKSAEEQYAYVLEAMSDGVVMVDVDARITFANPRYAAMLGYTRAELVGLSAFDLFVSEDVDGVLEKLGRRRTGIAEMHEQRLRHKSGEHVWVLARSVPLMDENGAFEGSLSLITDVTESRRAREVKSRLEAVVEGTDDAVITCDTFGHITGWNAAASHMYGYGEAEILGSSLSVLVPDERAPEIDRILERVGSNMPLRHYETQHLREDGSTLDVSLAASPVRDREDRIVGATLIARDLSERRHAERRLRTAEEALRQSQKMDAIGRLAAGIAHDFNNLLSVVMSSTAFLLDDVPATSPLRGDIEEIAMVSRRASELTKQLLAFSRQQALEPRVLSLNDVVTNLERLLMRTLGEHVELELDLAKSLGHVFADRGQLEQVVLNLVVNARDAMPHGGALLIETRNAYIEGPLTSVQGLVPPGRYVTLAVTDNGCGMSTETMAQVFEPFFSTKDAGKGTGLGLATVFGVVTQSNGYIVLESEPLIGTCVRILLPRSDEPATRTSIPPPHAESLRGNETILLVEDDVSVRRAMRTSLARLGYSVLEAGNGGEALLLEEEHAGTIHLLITDVVMPRMGGVALAARLAQRRPSMRVLFVSGHAREPVAGAGGAAAYLRKPFMPDALARKIRETLESNETVP